MNQQLLAMALVILAGCANRIAYYDLTARTNIPDGVSSNMQSMSGQVLATWGAFGTSSIWVAYPNRLPDSVIVAWRDAPKRGEYQDHRRIVAITPLLLPLDPTKQKYHLQFWFFPGDSLRVQADVLDIGDCRHTKGIGKTRTPQHGPCGVKNDW